MTDFRRRPPHYSPVHDPVYSNFDHKLDEDIVAVLSASPTHAQHAAWDFCGYVWHEPESGEWLEEVWVYNDHVETLRGPTAHSVIQKANGRYGSG